MTLQQLVYAVKIADTKSMNKAAAELYVSQPALSSTIRDLEEELNIELFIRTNRGIVITEGTEKHTIFILTLIKKKKSIRVFMILVDFLLGEI